VAGRIRSIGKSSDLIRNGTHDLLACSIVPQPTMLLLAPLVLHSSLVIYEVVVFISFRYKKSGSGTFLDSNFFLINNSMEIT
jgi:hypothetical protein